MFALHYFFSSERSARNAIEMAAANLKPGGYFFGVLPDGRNVLDTIGPSMKVRRLCTSLCLAIAVRMHALVRTVMRGSIPCTLYTCILTDATHTRMASCLDLTGPSSFAGWEPLILCAGEGAEGYAARTALDRHATAVRQPIHLRAHRHGHRGAIMQPLHSPSGHASASSSL